MNESGQKIIDFLRNIKGNGSFFTSHTAPFVFPGLEIEGLGELSYPINELQAKALIQKAGRAPFGKGLETVFDDTVRKAREIDSDKLSFRGTEWERFLQSVLKTIQPQLGIENYEIEARLYKMLIYEKGDFFLSHKDTEKEKGMFGTLIIGLPSKHSGGELIIRFDGKEEVVSFAGPASNYQIPCTAFYSDCDHEVRQLTGGYRVCLVYNLIQLKANKCIQPEPLKNHISKLASIFSKQISHKQFLPGVVLLGHQYTPENFSKDNLKLDDRTKAEALLRAAKQAGYYAKMCLVTSFVGGTPEYNGGYGWGDEPDEYSEMEEVFDEWIQIEHWLDNGIPPLRSLRIEESDLLASFKINDDEPVVREIEGYMGNYGPELSYWYHYGAVVFWPKDHHGELLLKQGVENQLEWIAYYNQNRKQLTKDELTLCESIINLGLNNNNSHIYKSINYEPVIDWLIGYEDEAYFEKAGYLFLQRHFTEIIPEQWVKLLEAYPSVHFDKIFNRINREGNVDTAAHLLSVLVALPDTPDASELIKAQMQQVPAVLLKVSRSLEKNQKPVTSRSLKDLITLEHRFPQTQEWVDGIAKVLINYTDRDYVNKTLSKTLIDFKNNTALGTTLLAFCRKNLQSRVNDKPQPPADWSRPVPDKPREKRYWNLLADFLKSPDQQVFEYKKIQRERTELENVIRHTTIDLKTETIKKGSPHTLRITKTQAAYQKKLKAWNEDEILLRKVLRKIEA